VVLLCFFLCWFVELKLVTHYLYQIKISILLGTIALTIWEQEMRIFEVELLELAQAPLVVL
jgi:hypothetical protein